MDDRDDNQRSFSRAQYDDWSFVFKLFLDGKPAPLAGSTFKFAIFDKLVSSIAVSTTSSSYGVITFAGNVVTVTVNRTATTIAAGSYTIYLQSIDGNGKQRTWTQNGGVPFVLTPGVQL